LIGTIVVFALLPLIPTRSQLKEWKTLRDSEEEAKRAFRKERRAKRYEEEEELLKKRGDDE